jgi:transaldolase
VDAALAYAKKNATDRATQITLAMDKLFVLFGIEILKVIPGRVSTEIDARLSFDVEATVARCKALIALYEAEGINPRERVLFKIASTWEGIRAAEILEAEGIHCNMTLLFSFSQAVACAEAGVTLISPFVGRILDWHKKATPDADFTGAKDPGVISVTKIYKYYKSLGYPTIVMGASFRSKEEVLMLAGCDYLTISPQLLGELQASTEPITRYLNASEVTLAQAKPPKMTEIQFRWELNEDAVATEKTAEGIRGFTKDIRKLEADLAEQLGASS